MAACLAIQGTRGATKRRSSVRRSIHFTVGTRHRGIHALNDWHLKALTPSTPIACPGHARTHRSHPVHNEDSGLSNPPVFWAGRPVTTPLRTTRGPN